MQAIKAFSRFASLLSLSGAIGAVISIFFMVSIILVEIILRSLFSTSTFMMDELVGYAVSASAFLALGYTFEKSAIIRVTLLIDLARNRKYIGKILEIMCCIFALSITGFLIYYFYGNVERQFMRGYSSGTMSGMPQWIPTSIMLFGLVTFWFQLLSYSIEVLFAETPNPKNKNVNIL